MASSRSLEVIGIVDDGAHESVAAHPEHAMRGDHFVCILERICASRGYPQIIRTLNGKKFTGKPNENAYLESVNARFRDVWVNEHWFLSLMSDARPFDHRGMAQGVRRGTMRKAAGRLMRSEYAEKLTTKSDTLTERL